MINKSFENIFPFAYNYFSTLFNLIESNERKFPQAIIFEGTDTVLEYLFSLELARNLNCKKSKEANCNCMNCTWIKSHTHPSVQNVSQIHFKGEDDETKTVISVKQAKEIEKALLLSSDYYRFFIFFSSKEKDIELEDREKFEKFGYDGNINYSIDPLDFSTFHQTTPNALLKSVEEPPKNTCFIFLTKSRENILPTIVSRCLVFKLNSKQKNLNYAPIKNIIEKYPNINNIDAINISEIVLEFIKENQISLEEFLNLFLAYLKDLLLSNLNNIAVKNKIENDITLINYALKLTHANIQDKNVIETLFLRISRGF